MSTGIEVGIVAALEREIRDLVTGWRTELVNSGTARVRIHRAGSAVLICSGPTKGSAAAAAQLLVERYAPSVLLSAGFAGALNESVHVGQVIVPAEVVDASSGRRFRSRGGSGVLVTTDAVAGRERKTKLGERWSAVAVDMEASGVAEVAEAAKCGFAAVKAISDEASAEMDFVGEFVRPEGFRTMAFLCHAAMRPSLWPAVHHLRINSEQASSKLSSTLKQILASKEGIIGGLALLSSDRAAINA